MARRLIESGVKLVTVYWHRERRTIDTTWDTHSRNFYELKDRLMPSVDRPIAALLEDLENIRAARRNTRRLEQRIRSHAEDQHERRTRSLGSV